MIFIDQIFNNFGAILGLVIIVFILMISVLWILLPLHVFQIKNRTDDQLKETKLLKKDIESIKNILSSQRNI